uniref:Peptidase A1 domain-containing protein n=1 Tax=Oryza nivara TaxID=4536 RepID=A0A0E0HDT6_ORYNI
MADRTRAVSITIASHLIVILATAMVVSPNSVDERFGVSPRTNTQLGAFLKENAADMATRLPRRPYVFSLIVGTPPQNITGALHINGELVSMPCVECAANTPCNDNRPDAYLVGESRTLDVELCTSQRCQRLAPQNQRTCGGGSRACQYTYTYGGRNETAGFLATEAFAFGETRANVTFACGVRNVESFGGAPGVVGLSRGNLSLVTQLQLGRFSYYLAPEEDHAGDAGNASFVLFGDDAAPRTGNTSYTRLVVTNATGHPDYYYVALAGVRVGAKNLAIAGGGGGGGSLDVVVSSSLPITYLEKSAYDLLKQQLMSTLGSNTADGSALGLDLCYTNTGGGGVKEFPAMALVFAGGEVMELKPRNYVYRDESTGLVCLTILPSPEDVSSSALGTLIQTGTHMIYDVQGSRLGFESFDLLPSKSGSSDRPPSSAATPPRNISPATIACFVWCVVASIVL